MTAALHDTYETLLATTINFEKLSYSSVEAERTIQPVLILSNPLTKDIAVKVLTTDGSTEGG